MIFLTENGEPKTVNFKKGQSAKVNESISHNLLIQSILPLKKMLEISVIKERIVQQ
jgi:hypothetical protein